MATTLTKENLAAETSAGLVLVDFWAPWCGPCKTMAKTIARLEDQFGDQIKFATLNVDHNQELALKYRVMSLPSLVFFKDGKAVEKVTGVYPQENLATYLEQKIATKS